jgi:hypothetical protein
MNIQLITDENGLTKGIYIPYEEWESFKKDKGISQEEISLSSIQMEELEFRLGDFLSNSESRKSWNEVKDALM